MLFERFRIWQALMLRDIRTRRGESPYDYLITLAEPIGQIGLVYAVFTLVGRKADFGTSLLLFLMSGVLPFFLFTHVAARVIGTVRNTRSLLALPRVAAIDVAISRFILETLSVSLIGVLLFVIAWAIGIPGARPHDVVQMILAAAMIALTAFGVGLSVGCLAIYSGVFRLIWTLIARSLIFFSNVFYVVDFLHHPGRQLLGWNPLLHGVIWFRTGIYDAYPANSLSQAYMISFCVLSILFGLALERSVRRRI